jgi:hypothetical protein
MGCFDPGFQRCESKVRWTHCFGPLVEVAEQTAPLITRNPKGKRKRPGPHSLSRLCPSLRTTKPYFLRVPLFPSSATLGKSFELTGLWETLTIHTTVLYLWHPKAHMHSVHPQECRVLTVPTLCKSPSPNSPQDSRQTQL